MEEKIPDNVIVTQKFIERAGKRIGIYYGETLAYYCGTIPEEPDITYIVGNSGYEAFAEFNISKEVRYGSTRKIQRMAHMTESHYPIYRRAEYIIG